MVWYREGKLSSILDVMKLNCIHSRSESSTCTKI